MKIYDKHDSLQHEADEYRIDLDKFVGKDVWLLLFYEGENWWVKFIDTDSCAGDYCYIVYATIERHYGPVELPTESLAQVCSRKKWFVADDICLYWPISILTTEELYADGFEPEY